MVQPRKSRRVPTSALADTFVARRHQLRLTQSDLALLAGVGRSTVQSIEGGKESVQLDRATAVADALGCALELVTKSGAVIPPLEFP